MNFRNTILALAGIAALAMAAPAGANSVAHPTRTASGNGQLCSDTDPTMNPCQNLTNNPIGTTNFFETSSGSGLSYYDIFSVSGIAAGSTVTFTFATTPDNSVQDEFGAFLCDNFVVSGQPGSAYSADGKFMSNACTGLAPGVTDISSLVANGPVTTWTFTDNGGISTWFFYALSDSKGNSPYLPTSVKVTQGSSMPEPGSFAMLGAGLLGLAALKLRLRSANSF